MQRYEQLLAFARDRAEQGLVGYAEFYLKEAGWYAKQDKKKIPTSVIRDISEIAYRTKTGKLIREAKRWATYPYPSRVSYELKKIDRLVEKAWKRRIGIRIGQEELAEVEKLRDSVKKQTG